MALKEKITKNVYEANENGKYIENITFHKFQRGSVKALFTVNYQVLDSSQLVTFSAKMSAVKKLQNMSIADDFVLKSPSIPCESPKNITYNALNETTIEVR